MNLISLTLIEQHQTTLAVPSSYILIIPPTHPLSLCGIRMLQYAFAAEQFLNEGYSFRRTKFIKQKKNYICLKNQNACIEIFFPSNLRLHDKSQPV